MGKYYKNIIGNLRAPLVRNLNFGASQVTKFSSSHWCQLGLAQIGRRDPRRPAGRKPTIYARASSWCRFHFSSFSSHFKCTIPKVAVQESPPPAVVALLITTWLVSI